MKLIQAKLGEKDVKPELHPKKWKLTYVKTRESEDTTETPSEAQPDFCKVQVHLLKVPGDTHQIAVEFSRLAGSAWYFHEQFSIIKEQIEL